MRSGFAGGAGPPQPQAYRLRVSIGVRNEPIESDDPGAKLPGAASEKL